MNFAIDELKSYSPIPTDPDGPLSFSVTFQLMKIKAMRVNIRSA
jgi:hypothetical protein